MSLAEKQNKHTNQLAPEDSTKGEEWGHRKTLDWQTITVWSGRSVGQMKVAFGLYG